MCKGLGAVPTSVCRGCGRPAWKRIQGVEFCGEDKCLNSLVKERTHRFGTYSSTVNRGNGSVSLGFVRNGVWQKNRQSGNWEMGCYGWPED